MIVTKGTAVGTTDYRIYLSILGTEWQPAGASVDQIACMFFNDSYSGPAPVLTDAKWHQLTCSYDRAIGAHGQIAIYLDGKQYLTWSPSGYPTGTDAYNWEIGYADDAGGRYFTGDIDTVRIYTRAISATEA